MTKQEVNIVADTARKMEDLQYKIFEEVSEAIEWELNDLEKVIIETDLNEEIKVDEIVEDTFDCITYEMRKKISSYIKDLADLCIKNRKLLKEAYESENI